MKTKLIFSLLLLPWLLQAQSQTTTQAGKYLFKNNVEVGGTLKAHILNSQYGRIITGFPGTGIIENNYGLDYINLISQVNAYNNYSALFAAYGINRYGSYLAFIKSRTADGNTYNRVVNGDEIMMLESTVDVGSYLSTKARIATYVDGTPAGDFCPARIEMWTAPAGGYNTKRLTIFNDGNVAINNSANAGYKLDVNGTVRLSENTDISGSLSVSDASTPAIPTAKVAINSTTKGFLTPRMTSGQRDLILSPEEGLEIYNLTTHSKEFWNGTVWKTITTN